MTLSPEQQQILAQLLPTLSPEQKLWLSGFFAGSAGALGAGGGVAQSSAAKVPLTILYGTESGNCEALAADIKKKAAKSGFKPTLVDMFDITPEDMTSYENLMVVVSTWGEGDPPERAESFYHAFIEENSVSLPENMKYGVLALGDTSYVDFCEVGKRFDTHLEALGASRLVERVDCDVDYEDAANAWIDSAIQNFRDACGVEDTPASADVVPLFGEMASQYDKSNPFPATISECITLNDLGSNKETLHLELSLEGSGLTYTPGDSLGIVPVNNAAMVEEVLQAVGLSGDEDVSGVKLREALTNTYDINGLTIPVVQAYAQLTDVDALKDREAAQKYTQGRELIDLLTDHPKSNWNPAELVGLLRKLSPRLYSIASSQASVEDEVHLTIAVVRYHTHGRDRQGVTSSFVADRVKKGDKVKVYVNTNKHFRLPADDVPVIMVGPGTGVAPFRAFMQQREVNAAKGKNWLFFGDQHYLHDFLYQIEWQSYLEDGLLTKLSVAFSRDLPKKVYVQDKMWENREELFRWIDIEKASFYVCGDEQYMAKDVDAMLRRIIADQMQVDNEQAAAYVQNLRKEQRYLRDVY